MWVAEHADLVEALALLVERQRAGERERDDDDPQAEVIAVFQHLEQVLAAGSQPR
ncbi:MAG: hypothetical protein ACR2ND_05595 [Solirubrobacteraceae bacterium]